jgi:hypothetical protein
MPYDAARVYATSGVRGLATNLAQGFSSRIMPDTPTPASLVATDRQYSGLAGQTRSMAEGYTDPSYTLHQFGQPGSNDDPRMM